MYRTLVYQYRTPVAVIALNRPRVSNRVDLTMAMELREVCQRLREEPDIRVVILTGKGQIFSSGHEPPKGPQGSRTKNISPDWLDQHRAACLLSGVEIPLIAAINGDALDHGLELALACDLRIASRSARLGFTGLSRGIIPWDGGTQRLPRLVGITRALEMLLISRVVDAQEAYKMGLVNMIAEPESLMDTAHEVAMQIAAAAPIAARYAKEAVMKGMDMTVEQGLRLEADLSIILQSTSDRAEGIRSFLERRQPEFKGK